MAGLPPDTALLDINDVAGRLEGAVKERFYAVIASALADTTRFRLLPRAEMPDIPPAQPTDELSGWQEALAGRGVNHVFVTLCEESTHRLSGQPCWKFTFLLFDLRDGRRLAMKEAFLGKEAPAEDLKWSLYEFADADRFAELAKEHRLTELARDPERLNKDVQFLTTLVMACLQKGDWDTALETSERLLRVEGRNPLALHAKALSLFRRGRLQEARDAVEASLRVRPNPEGFLLKGDVSASAGREDLARESYREAAKLDPEGARAQAKLCSLDHFTSPDRDPLAPLRIGWMWGYLQYVGVMAKEALSDNVSSNALAVGAEIERQYREIAGVHPARLVGPEHWNAWVRSVSGGDMRAFKEASEAFFGAREAVQSVEDCLPGAMRRWLKMARELFWVQAVFYSITQHWEAAAGNPPLSEQQAFAEHAAALARDAVLDVSFPALAAFGRRMEACAARPYSKDKMEEAVALIERFRRAIFEEDDEEDGRPEESSPP